MGHGKTGHVAPTSFIFFLLWVTCVAQEQWYQGCFYDKPDIQPVLPFPRSDGDDSEVTAVTCSRYCFLEGFEYAGILNGSTCYCGNSYQYNYGAASDEECNSLCPGDPNLPCGGANTTSIYSVYAPFLVSLTVTVPRDTVQENEAAVVEVSAELSSTSDSPLGLAGFNSSHFTVMDFAWDVSGTINNKQSLVEDVYASSSVLHTFTSEGTYTIDVIVSNALSSLQASVNITVVMPVPSDLDIGRLAGSGKIPSCIPEHSAIPENTATISGYVDTEIQFQAAVVYGVNLTFSWEFSDDGTPMISPKDPTCQGISCLQDIQPHTFTSTGLYSVTVEVFNSLGSVQGILYVIIVDKSISNVTLEVAPGDGYYNTPYFTISFLVTIVTAHRKDTTMFVNFGDGYEYEHSLDDTNQTMIGGGMPDLSALNVVANYGIGCSLNLEFSHAFMQIGNFNVSVRMDTDHDDTEIAYLPQLLVVQNRVLLFPYDIMCDPVVRLHGAANFSVQLYLPIEELHYEWRVTGINVNVSDTIEQTNDIFTYTFTEVDSYLVKVNVSNLVSFQEVSRIIKVEEEIVDFVLDIDGPEVIQTGDTVSVLATVTGGTDVTFVWNFVNYGFPLTEALDIDGYTAVERANYTFGESGNFDLVVTAQNSISSRQIMAAEQYIVQDPVQGLLLKGDTATLLGNTTKIVASVAKGTDVMFDIDCGRGREAAQGVLNVDGSYTITYVLDTTGIHLVTVYAYNNISVDSNAITVRVEEEIDDLIIEVLNEAVVGEETTLVAKVDGVIQTRSDLLYTWTINDMTVKTPLPILHHTFTEIVSNQPIQVTVYNFVVRKTSQVEINIAATSDLYLSSAATTEVGQATRFTLKIADSTVVDISVDYGNGIHDSLSSGSSVNEYTWNYTYPMTGVYEVSVNVSDGSVITNLAGIVSIQEVITDLELTGPTAVEFYRPFKILNWLASISNGTAVMYDWTIQPLYIDSDAYQTDVQSMSLTSRYKRRSSLFETPGLYNVSVVVSNALGSSSVSMETVLQDPIISVSLSVVTVLHEDPSIFVIVVQGGKQFTFDIDFGDGDGITFASEMHNFSEYADYSGDVPQYTYHVPKVYSNIGQYSCSFNISNDVSETTRSVVAYVEEPITGLTLQADRGSVFERNEYLTMTAQIATGTDIVFTWNFNDDDFPIVQTIDNTSIANHQFSTAGEFNVSVSVWNDLYDEPITLQYPTTFMVQEPITDLDISPLSYPFTAALEVTEFGNHSTAEIFFDVYATGVPATFEVDFDDDTPIVVVDGEEDLYYGESTATVGHLYTEVGNYTPCVTAVNLLGNATYCMFDLFHVQFAPEGLTTDHNNYVTVFGNDTVIHASLVSGSNVKFDWSMGDQTNYIDAGSSVNHRYLSPGLYFVTLQAYNKVQYLSKQVVVSVQSQVQGIQVNVENLLQETNTLITFTVETVNEAAIFYEWDMGDGKGTTTTTIKQRTYEYTQAGTYYVTVKAKNDISSVTSAPIEMEVQTVIAGLSIISNNNPTLIGQLTDLFPIALAGSDMYFEWDFGDNTSLSTTINAINHQYQNLGVYHVHVFVSNLVSNASADAVVFILETMCRPPELQIYNTFPQHKRNNDLRIEVDVIIVCEVTAVTTYKWTVYRDGQKVQFDDDSSTTLNQRTLFIPSKTLDYGTYTLNLEVKMNGTIVYSRGETTIDIVPSDLIAIIEGGTSRLIGSNESVTLNAEMSYDPDFIENEGLSYNWTCNLLDSPSSSCFDDVAMADIVSPLDTNSSVLTFQSSLLKQDPLISFVFWLKVSKEGREDVYTSQVLEIAAGHPLESLIYFAQPGMAINSNNKLTFMGTCGDCEQYSVVYSWELFVVLDGVTTNTLPASYRCVAADGSDYAQFLLANGTQSNSVVDTTTLPEGQHTISNEIDSNPGYNVGSELESSDLFSNQIQEYGGPVETDDGDGGGDPFYDYIGEYGFEDTNSDVPIDEDTLVEGETDGRDPATGTGDTGWDYGSDGLTEGGTGDEGGNGDVLEEGEGTGRGTGSGTNTDDGTEGSENTDDDGNDGGGDQVRDEDLSPLMLEEHIVSKTLQPVIILDSQTSTGVNGKSLVINDGVLDEGRSYAVALTLTSSNGKVERQGLSNYYFTVNTGPMWGQCTVSPDHGVEMDTQFTITCPEWIDDDLPLVYEISYSIGQDTTEELLYYGMKTIITFQLPAGDENDNSNAYLHIAIVDNRGGKTKVCSIAVQVTPKQLTGSTSAEHILHGYVVGSESQLSIYMQNGDDQSVQLYVRMISSMINRLNPLDSKHVNFTQDLRIRQEIRFALLQAIDFLSIRDASDVLQYAMILSTITASPSELSVKAMLLAAELVEKMAEVLLSIADIPKETCESILNPIAVITSNLLKASDGSYAVVPLRKKETIVVTTIGATEKLLQSHQKMQAIDETALEIDTEMMDVYSATFSQLSSVCVTKGDAQFQFPSNMNEVLTHLEGGVMKNCYGVKLLAFNDNPYTWSPSSSKVATDVSSFEVLSCDGGNLTIKDLREPINIQLPRTPEEHIVLHNFTFDKEHVNYHEFNVSVTNMEQSFHLIIELLPVEERGFPIKLIMRYEELPTPYDYMFERLFDENVNIMKVYFPAGYFNNTGTYYLGVMDGEFGEFKYRPDSVTVRDYTIKQWWGECLYWSPSTVSWLSDGCQTMESSTYDSTHCKCNHLTNFGGGFFNAPQEFSLTEISQFERETQNAVTYSFVIVLFSVYIILFFYCYFADIHDEKKRGVIYLQDNQPSDQQCYEVTVETGFRMDAGTSAKVSIVLHGDMGRSETRELTAENKPLFERNSRDRFVISVPESLGTVYKIHVWHNNAGVSPSWFLSRMAVRDLITGQKWYFICEKWFAVEEDDGKVERDLYSREHGVGFQKVLFAKGSQYFADYHLWSSIFTRPAHSRFSKVQRLTCCLAILLTFMCINAVWYHFNDRPEWTTHLGLIDVSIESVVVGIVTALVALPINGPIVMLFRRSRPKQSPSQAGKLYSTRKRTSEISSNETVETLLTGEPFYPSVVEETAWTWQSLQSWAQNKWKYRHRFQDLLSGSKESLHSDPGVVVDRDSSDQSSETREPVEVLQQQQQQQPLPQPQQVQPPAYDSASCSSGFGDLSSEDRNRLLSDSDLPVTDTNSLVSTTYQDKPVTLPVHKKFTKIMLPYWCRYIAWFMTILVVFWSTFFTVMFGIRFEKSKSVLWIQSLYFSILQCVFVTQPLVILVMSLIQACQFGNDIRVFDHTDDNTELIDPGDLPKSRLEYYADTDDLAKGIAARQRSRYLRFARPPQEKELKQAKEKMLKEKKMYSILKGWVFYGLLFTCVMWICYGKFHNQHIMLNESVKNTFVRTPHPFTGIQTISDFWTWCENDLLDGLYWDSWYNSQHVNEDKGAVIGGSLVLLGQTSFRQLRVPSGSCKIPSEMSGLVDDCRAGYGESGSYRMAYGPNETWDYQGNGDIVRYCKWGLFDHYDGEGYVVILNGSRLAALDQIQFLKEENWIDVNTRLVIVEFTLYNPPTNLYTSVMLMVEMPGTGGVFPTPFIASVMLYRYETFYDYFVMFWELMFLGLVVYSIKCEISQAIKEKKDYFLQIWTYIEIFFSLFSLLFFCCYVYRWSYVNEISERLQATYYEEFVDMSFLAFWDQILRDVGGAILFLVFIKLFQAFRFLKVVARFGNVVSFAIKQILVFWLWYSVVLLLYSAIGNLVFGTYAYGFSDMSFAIQTMTATLRGGYDYSELMKIFPVGVPLFYITYIITVLILLMGMARALLNHSYREAGKKEVDSFALKEVLFFSWQKFLLCTGIRKPPGADDDNDSDTVPPEFTMAEFEYQVDELEFRINAISHQHGMPEKLFNYYDDSDGTFGVGDDGISSSGSEMRLFNDLKFNERIQKIEDGLYSMNPQLRELVEYSRFENDMISNDREKQLRSELELEIFRQLQFQRQDGHLKMEQHDSGRDSISDPQDLVCDEVTPSSPLPVLNSTDGKIAFPEPLSDIGLLEQTVADDISVKSDQTSHTIIEVKPKGDDHSAEGHMCSICNSENESTSSQSSSQHPCPPKEAETCQVPHLGSLYDSSTSGYTSDNISKHFRQQRGAASSRSKSLPRPPVSEIIRDEPLDSSSSSNLPKHSESFPTLNALFSSHENLYESTSEDDKRKQRQQRPKTSKEPEGRRKLRKTKTRGKGKGKRKMSDDDDYTFHDNCRSGSDSDSEIRTIHMYPYGTAKDCW
ncbi:polycystin-1-like protein 1 [Glandiceps talaboti]